MFFISSKKLFSFSRYSIFCNFSPSFPHFPDCKGYKHDDIIKFKIYLGSGSKAMADRENKSGRWKYKNLNNSRTKKAFWMK